MWYRIFQKEHPSYTHTAHYRISAKALVWNEEHTAILLCRELRNGKWDFPGGGIEHGQSAHEALRREVHEEMGVNVTHISDAPVAFTTSQWNDSKKWFALLFFDATIDSLEIVLSEECQEVRFFDAESVTSIDAYASVRKFFDENWERLTKKIV